MPPEKPQNAGFCTRHTRKSPLSRYCFTSLNNSQKQFYKLRRAWRGPRYFQPAVGTADAVSPRLAPGLTRPVKNPERRGSTSVLAPAASGVPSSHLSPVRRLHACFLSSLEFSLLGKISISRKLPRSQGSPYPLPGADSRTEHLAHVIRTTTTAQPTRPVLPVS